MTILAATDFSETSKSALRVAAAEAKRRGTSLAVMHCIDSFSERWEYIQREDEDLEAQLREAAQARLETSFADAVPRQDQPEIDDFIIDEGSAPQSIVETAHRGDYELVVLAATGGGPLARLLLGSTAEEVVRSCEVPVFVVPKGTEVESVNRILAPVDLSDCSRQSLEYAADQARSHDAHLSILHVSSLPSGAMTLLEWEPDEDQMEAHKEFHSRQMGEFLDSVDLAGVDHDEMLRFAAPDREIVDVARDREINLIVMGTHGRRGMSQFFLGSTASKVLRHLPCPAITVRHQEEDETS